MSISLRNNCVNITLPDGRSVNIGTKQGANQFILQGVLRNDFQGRANNSPCTFFSQNIGKVEEVCDRIYQRRNKKPTREENKVMGAMYTVTSQLAENADYDVFDDIPVHEVQMFLDHVLVEIGRMTEASSSWARTGNLKYHEEALLEGLMPLLTQRKPAGLALEVDLFGTLAKFASAPSTMKEDPAEMITMIVANVVNSTLVHEDILISTDMAFAKLESCGMLEQFIRLSVVNQMSNPVVLKCYDDLRYCTSLIEKKFTEDHPCGKACKEILGRSSLNRHPVVGKLRMIASCTNWIEKPADLPKEMRDGFRCCRKCNKMVQSLEFQKSLLKCSRCKSVFYCSKECQVTDWKAHKPFCEPFSSKESKVLRFNEESVNLFVEKNYVGILKEIVKVSVETGKTKGDLLLELDFYDSDENGRGAPALQTPPQFKVAESKGYFEGSRPNEPDWFCKSANREYYETNIPMFVKSLKDLYIRLADYHLFVLVRPPDNLGFGAYRVQLQSPTTKNHMLSQNTIDAAIEAIQDSNFGPLSSLFGVGTDETRRLCRALGGRPDDDGTLDLDTFLWDQLLSD